MVFRLLYRLLLQSLDRDAAAEPERSGTARGRTKEGPAPFRHAAGPLIIALSFVAVVVVAISVLLPPPTNMFGDVSANLSLSIPDVDAKPLVVYLHGAGLAPPRPGPEPSRTYRIRSIDGRFSPEFQVVPYASTMEMFNADSIAHNTHVFSRGETVFNVALPVRGVTVRKVLTGSGIFRVRCDMHTWMKAWLFVSPSRHYAVLREPTTINFAEIEPGEYSLHVWQPDRGESTLLLNLEAGETRRLRLR